MVRVLTTTAVEHLVGGRTGCARAVVKSVWLLLVAERAARLLHEPRFSSPKVGGVDGIGMGGGVSRLDDGAATSGADGAPGWVRHVIWWHVYPLGFVGADTSGADRDTRRRVRSAVALAGLRGRAWRERLALGPIFASGSHGYDTVDYFGIDPRLGDEDGFAGSSRPRTSAG